MYRDKTFEELVAMWNRTLAEIEATGADPDGFFYPVANAFCRFRLRGIDFLLSQLPAEDSERGYALLLSGIRYLPIPRDDRIDLLIPYLDGTSWLLKVAALHALKELKAHEAKLAVERCVNDAHPSVRIWAVRFLTQLWPYDFIHLVEAAWIDPDPGVRAKAIEHVSWCPDQSLPAKYEDRVWALLEGDDEDIRFEANWFLMEQCLRDMFGRPDSRSPEATPERMRIFKTFLAHDKDDHELMIDAAWDESPLVRREAAHWIWHERLDCADDHRPGTLDRLRNDPDPRVRLAFVGE